MAARYSALAYCEKLGFGHSLDFVIKEARILIGYSEWRSSHSIIRLSGSDYYRERSAADSNAHERSLKGDGAKVI